MIVYENILSINENSKTSKINQTRIVGNILAWDTRTENYHPLNNNYNDGFILITKFAELGDFQNHSDINIDKYRTEISKVRMCVSQELSTTIDKNCVLNSIKYFNRYFLINSTNNSVTIENDLLVLLNNYDYLINVKKLCPFDIGDVRRIIYLIMLNETDLNERIVFYVKDDKYNDSEKLLYIILTPTKNLKCSQNNKFSINVVYTFNSDLISSDDLIEQNESVIDEFLRSKSSESTPKGKKCDVISRYDVPHDQHEGENRTTLSCRDELNKEIGIPEEYTRNACAQIPSVPFSTMFVRWGMTANERLLPAISNLNIDNIKDGLFALKIDVESIDSYLTKTLTDGISSLEYLIYNDFENISTNDETLCDDLCTPDISELTNKLSRAWEHYLLGTVDHSSGNDNLTSDTNDIRSRSDLDFTDYIWSYIKDMHDVRTIKGTIKNILASIGKSLDKSCGGELVPRIRNENTTILAELARIAIEIYRYNVYTDENNNSSQEHSSNIKDKKLRWDSMVKKYFENCSVFKSVIIQIGFENVITDIKAIIKKSEPLIGDKYFDWHFNELYSKYNSLIELQNTEELKEVKTELLKRTKMLVPVCYISDFLVKNKFTWDISKKLIHSSIKYYSNPNYINLPTIFVAPIYDKNVIVQFTNCLTPNQVEVFPVSNPENFISLSKIVNKEPPGSQANIGSVEAVNTDSSITIHSAHSEAILKNNVIPTKYSMQIYSNLNK